MAINIKTTSQLEPVKSLDDESLFFVSEHLSTITDTTTNLKVPVFGSRSISAGKLKSEVNDYVSKQLESKLNDISSVTNSLTNGNDYWSRYRGDHYFDKLPYSYETITNFNGNGDKLVNVNSLKNYEKDNNSLYIDGSSTFVTKLNNVENNNTETKTGIENAMPSDWDKHNVYIFHINGYQSNEWDCPAGGIFSCYGWVDERNDNDISNAKRWVALEGKFSKNGGTYWKILNLQPVIPNMYCSYVSFMFPVKQGMTLRLRAGFNVGTNSNKYASVQGSMTNHIANAFVGGIYTTSGSYRGLESSDYSLADRSLQARSLETNAVTAINLTENNMEIEARDASGVKTMASISKNELLEWLGISQTKSTKKKKAKPSS